MFCICNVILLVGTMESLEKDEGLIPLKFGKKNIYIYIYISSQAFHEYILCQTLVIGMELSLEESSQFFTKKETLHLPFLDLYFVA